MSRDRDRNPKPNVHVLWKSLLAALCVSGLLAGCGEPAKPVLPAGTVSGTVLFNGKPVTEGTVIFENAKDAVLTGAPLGAEGKFQKSDVRALDYVVYIVPKPVTPGGDAGPAPAASAAPADIPAKYSVAATSGFKATVKAGTTNDFKFEMK